VIKHLVFWKLLEEAEGASREENTARMKAAIEELVDDIPEIVSIEVGVDMNRSNAAWDVALYSTFESAHDLATYQAHPAHQRVAEFVGRVTSDRAVIDYEV
jgi:hypothetical protein